jgi:transposase
LRDSELTKLLGWPGYRVYRHEIKEKAKTLKLWIRRKRGNRKLVCSGCGRKLEDAHDVSEREVRDLPCMEFRTTVVVEIYRVCCPDCGIKIEKVPQLPSKAPFSKRFEDAVGQACESAAARQVALRFCLASSTVRSIDLRYLERWAAARRKPALVQMGVDEVHLGKKQKFITVVSNLDASAGKRQELNQLFALNRKVFKAYLLKESLDRLWTYHYEGAMLNYLQRWIDQLRWQRLAPFHKLAQMLLDHLDGILNYCRTKVPLGVVEAINGNIKSLLRRGRGYKNLRYLLLKAQRMAATRSEFVVFKKAA